MNKNCLVITSVRMVEYIMPLKRPYGTARSVTRASGNFLVDVEGEIGGQVFKGIGEGQPRHDLTGDGDKKRDLAWAFLREACESIVGKNIDISCPDSSIAGVRDLVKKIQPIAERKALPKHKEKPFRGSQLGIEVALLDLVSRAQGVELAELLGKERDKVFTTVSTIPTPKDFETLKDKVGARSRYPMTRVKGLGVLSQDLELIKLVADADRSMGRDRPIWIDINEAYDMAQAVSFVEAVAKLMVEGSIPAHICIEGMLRKEEGDGLASLQKVADKACSRDENPNLDLRIMPDEGFWDIEDLDRINAMGGCRAVNIKTAKAGGLLASLELARAAVAADPDVHICIGGMVGTSDVTAWSLYGLAKALPRLDYITAKPPANVETRISRPRLIFKSASSSQLIDQKMAGVGTEVDWSSLVPYVIRNEVFKAQ